MVQKFTVHIEVGGLVVYDHREQYIVSSKIEYNFSKRDRLENYIKPLRWTAVFKNSAKNVN